MNRQSLRNIGFILKKLAIGEILLVKNGAIWPKYKNTNVRAILYANIGLYIGKIYPILFKIETI